VTFSLVVQFLQWGEVSTVRKYWKKLENRHIDISNCNWLFVHQQLVSILADWLASGADPIPVQRHYTSMPVDYVTRTITVHLTFTAWQIDLYER